jgi:hypothetical protein
MQGDGLRVGAGPAAPLPGVFIPLASFAGGQAVPLPPAGEPAAQSLVCCRSPGLTLPPPWFVIPNWPRAPAALLGVPGVGTIPVPVPARGTLSCSRARQASANSANVKAQIGIRMVPRKPRMSFLPLHRKDPKALPQYAEFEASNWTRNDIGVMFWTVAGDNCEPVPTWSKGDNAGGVKWNCGTKGRHRSLTWPRGSRAHG